MRCLRQQLYGLSFKNTMKKKNNIFTYLKTVFLAFACIGIMANPMTAHAAEYDTSLEGLIFHDHTGMLARAYIDGKWEYIYCIQRGYPFRSYVSDLQMVYATIDGHEGTIASNIRYLLSQLDGNNDFEYFRGWGSWELNGDHTDADTQTGTDGAPSSEAWNEAFTEFKEDDEDDAVQNRYTGSGGITKWFSEVRYKLTGHEGALPAKGVAQYKTKVKEITYAEAGVDMSQAYAFAILNYYCNEDSDAEGYSGEAKYQAKQALDWAVEYGFVTTVGGNGKYLRLVYEDSNGKYGGYGTSTYSGSCDGYVRTTIDPNEQYEAMKLYRQVVWKTTNMRMIPSFAFSIDDISSAEPIRLYWDEEQKLYTTTVSDANGVLRYFDFEIPNVTCTDNGDGTLTISSPNAISGTLTSLPRASRLEPKDGIFKMPMFLRWSLEGTSATFKYTAMKKDLKDKTFQYQDTEDSRTTGNDEDRFYGPVYNHSHDYSPACNWYCTNGKSTAPCKGEKNAGWKDGYTDDDGNHHDGHYTRHDHKAHCYHSYYCPYEENRTKNYWNGSPSSSCTVEWACGKEHYTTADKEITGTYIDWQDLVEYATGQKIIDPTYAYIKVETVSHEFPAETDTEILLIADNDEWNDLTYTMPNGEIVRHCSHLRVGEKFHLKYIYSYTGASKGFRIEFSLENKPYYQYNYLARMQSPQNATPIYGLRSGLSGDRFSKSFINVPHAKLVIDKTPITIRGVYTTGETAYTLNGTYTYDSGENWNDNVYLDALTTDQYDDWHSNKSADNYDGLGEKIATSNGSSELTGFKITKQDDKMQIIWVYDTEPEVFTSALAFGTAYIHVGEDKNYTKVYYDEGYNYAGDKMQPTDYTNWFYDFEEHNNVGGVGYFSSEYTDPSGTQSDHLIPSHTIYTQNNESMTYAIRNKVWQSDVDIKVSNFVQNTGAGITEHICQQRGRDNHDMNYNLYYTIDVENPKATIFADKQRFANNASFGNETTITPYDTTSDVYEFDVNNLISWGSTGASQTPASYGTTTVVDHIKTGTTYIQREIPTVLATVTSLPKETMTFKIYPNHDRLIYEDYYTGTSITGSGTSRRVTATAKDVYYPSNEKTAISDIWPAMNPNVKEMQPQNISGSNNVPDQYNQDDNVLHHMAPITSFNIRLSNGETKTVVDSHTKNYLQYDFEYNPDNRNNKVTFPDRRRSIMFFKYSKTNYSYNGNNVQSAVGEFRNSNKTQTESYYISQVLFKSNYTSKYKKELEHQGADYIEDYDANGNLSDAWIDMVNQNKFAIVSAGQGFELKVTLKYENSYLTQYLSRYFGQDDGQNDIVGTSNRVQKNYLTSATEKGRQFANISSLTGKDGRIAPFYKDTERAYISSNSILDRLAVNLVTGSNIFNDLYVFMSDNPDTVYSYSGIYDTPVIFERDIQYSEDFAVTTITYTMCVSHENGIASNLQKMKFYTNQLAPDKRSPGIVEGSRDVSSNGEHSITIWTPVVTATPFDYPNTMQDRYIGDAIELGYTIKTTGADDSIVHIVQ